MDKKPKKPNNRHIAFVKEYLANGMNGTRAYCKVYKTKKEKSAAANAEKLLRRSEIRVFLRENQIETSLKTQITVESQLQELQKIKELSLTPDSDGKLQLQASLKAIEIQNKMLGLNAPDQTQALGRDGQPVDPTIQIQIIKAISYAQN
jgi:hypothetical protein